MLSRCVIYKSSMGTKLQFALLLLFYSAPSFGELFQPECFDELGCFEHEYPWFWILRPYPRPKAPEKVNTTFFMANRDTKETFKIQSWPTIVINSNYRAKKPSYFVTHGYFSDSGTEWMKNITKAILSKEDANVFCVDWSRGSRTHYFQAASNTRMVAAEIRRVINYLIQNGLNTITDFHLMGHSLGAHIMAYVGKNMTGIERITALDPAQPGFQGRHPKVRIDEKDAKFIDVIHTDGKPFIPLLGLGMTRSVGTVDFFVNGGKYQPNCYLDGKPFMIKSIYDIVKITLEVIYNLATCSHTRAPRYLAAAIKEPCNMWGYRYNATFTNLRYTNFLITDSCSQDTCTLMGLKTQNFPARGNFAMSTSGTYPFCINNTDSDLHMKDITSKAIH